MASRLHRVPRPYLALAILAGTLAAGTLGWSAAGRPGLPAAAPPALFSKPEPAKNPVTLQLQADERQLVGWVSGPRDFSGRPVDVRLEGVKAVRLEVGKGNTFTWPCKVEK